MDDTPKDPKWTNVAVGVASCENNALGNVDALVPNINAHDHSTAGYRLADLHNSGVLGVSLYYGDALHVGGIRGVCSPFDSVGLGPVVVRIPVRVLVYEMLDSVGLVSVRAPD